MEKSSNNLLAFSAGVDSSALFFWLLEKDVSFDIAIVNYHTRDTSDEEVEYAKKLAKKYNKKIHIKECFLEKFSEKTARKCRYEFFEQIIKEYKYDTLITAHQLNDRLEWFLMQFTKGAGLKEMLSLYEWEERENYKIWRPFYNLSRKEILTFLNERDIKYYVDVTNYDIKYKRNFFRKEFSNKLLEHFEKGIKRSFSYLEEDVKLIFNSEWEKEEKLYRFKKSKKEIDLKKTDQICKLLGVLLTKKQRDEILKTGFSCVVQGKISVDSNEKEIFIAPYVKIPMPKEFKDKMRKNKIPPKVRSYIYSLEKNKKNSLS